MTKRVAILLYPGFDLIDAGGPYEVFLTASRLAERDGLPAQYEVLLVSPGGADAVAFGGMTITGLRAPEEVGAVDIALIPGTIDVGAAVADRRIVDAVSHMLGAAAVVTSVCTGAFLLANAGVLEGRPATTQWEDLGLLEQDGRTGPVARSVRWVDDGEIVTSGGLTSGIHMALHMVARDFGVAHAVRTARQLDLPWDPTGAA
ncbi:MAG TPA: DJ-1/PfpI family protein [Propionibacteriaceae bacterium]|nr:DJ-1/PfpI family protein [Propionibacteriaceae bacterium]